MGQRSWIVMKGILKWTRDMLKHLSGVLQGSQVMNNFRAKTTQIHVSNFTHESAGMKVMVCSDFFFLIYNIFIIQ